MQKRISDIFDVYEPDTETTFCTESFDAEKIKALTAKKIAASDKHAKPGRKTLRTLIMAATITCLLTVTAVAINNGIGYRLPADGEEFIESHDGENEGISFVRNNVAFILRVDVEKTTKEVFIRANWLPEDPDASFNAKEEFLWEAGFGHGIHEEPYDTEIYAGLLEKAGFSEQEAESWFWRLENTPGLQYKYIAYQIQVFNGDYLYKRDLTIGMYGGEAEIIKEGELNGFSLLELSMDNSEVYKMQEPLPFPKYMNYVILFSEELDCLIRIGGRMDLTTLEKIAENIELYQTNIELTAEEPEPDQWNWGMIDALLG